MDYARAAQILDPERAERFDNIEPVNEACRMAVEALNKRVPKKVEILGVNRAGYKYGACPSCLGLAVEYPYCRLCGQRLEWVPPRDCEINEYAEDCGFCKEK
jgi:hypothetical protein